MRRQVARFLLFLPLLSVSCTNDKPVPRFAGTIVSHVDSQGSGTGTSSQLSTTGQMRTGFDYTDESKTDWTADIKWSFLRRDGGSDVYRIEWARNGASVSQSAQLSFDGKSPAKLRLTDQLFISIEPMPSQVKA